MELMLSLFQLSLFGWDMLSPRSCTEFFGNVIFLIKITDFSNIKLTSETFCHQGSEILWHGRSAGNSISYFTVDSLVLRLTLSSLLTQNKFKHCGSKFKSSTLPRLGL